MLYKPSNPYPCNDVVDVTKDFAFECTVDSGAVYGYELSIGSLGKESKIHTSNYELSPPIYGNNGIDSTLQITYDASKEAMTNGNNYVWKLRLFDNNPSVWTAYGNTSGGGSYNTGTRDSYEFTIKYSDHSIYTDDLPTVGYIPNFV